MAGLFGPRLAFELVKRQGVMAPWLARLAEDQAAHSAASCHKTYCHEVRPAASVVFQHERRCRCRPSCRLARVTPDDFDNLSPVLDPPTCQACRTAKSEACCQAARVGRYLTQRRLTASRAIAPSRALAYSPARTRCHSILFPICPAGWPAAPGGVCPRAPAYGVARGRGFHRSRTLHKDHTRVASRGIHSARRVSRCSGFTSADGPRRRHLATKIRFGSRTDRKSLIATRYEG